MPSSRYVYATQSDRYESSGPTYRDLSPYIAGELEANHSAQPQSAAVTRISDLTLGHRLRIEERFIEGVSGVVVRMRYRLRTAYPETDSRWYLIISAGPNSGDMTLLARL